MNTKQIKAVVTLVLAISTMATMGFSSADNRSGAVNITAEHQMCQMVSSLYSAIELLDLADDPCFAELASEIETELDRGYYASASSLALIEEIYARSSAVRVAPVELFEAESDASLVRVSLRPSSRRVAISEWSVTETDVAEIELDRFSSGASSRQTLIDSILERSRAASPWDVDQLEPSGTATGYVPPSTTLTSLSSSALSSDETIDVLNRPQDEPRSTLIIDRSTAWRTSAVAGPLDVLNRPHDEPRSTLSIDRSDDWGLFEDEWAIDTLNRPQDEPRAK